MMFLIVLSSAEGAKKVKVKNSNTEIECFPEISTFQSVGHTSYCSYTWNGSTPVTTDVSFCFSGNLKSKKLKNRAGDLFYDVTDMVEFIHDTEYDKHSCYYMENLTWNPDTTKIIKLSYDTGLFDAKWDTYMGKVKIKKKDLILDPIFNNTLYEIGTDRTSDYHWNSTIDIDDYTSFIGSFNVSNTGIETFDPGVQVNLSHGLRQAFNFSEGDETKGLHSFLNEGNISLVGAGINTSAGINNLARGIYGTGQYFWQDPQTNSNVTIDGTNPFAISTWVYANSLGTHNWIMDVRQGPTPSAPFCFFFLSWESSILTASINKVGSGGASATHSGFGNGSWHHIVANFNNSVMSIYLDGVQGTDATYTHGGCTAVGKIAVGNYQNIPARWWDGVIDEMYFYDRALNVSEILFLGNNSDPNAFIPFAEPSPGNATGNTSKMFSYVLSKNISLPVFTNTIDIIAYYQGNFSINLSLNGNTTNWSIVEFGNNSDASVPINRSIVVPTLTTHNSLLNYQVLLYGIDTTLFNLSMLLNPPVATLGFFGDEKVTGNIVPYNITLESTHPAGFDFNATGNLSTNVSVDLANYDIDFFADGYKGSYTALNVSINDSVFWDISNVSFFDSDLNITVLNTTGSPISNFSVNITYSGWYEEHSTTTSLVNVNLTKDLNYTVFIDPPGFAIDNTTHYQVNNSMNITFNVTQSNSILIWVNDSITNTFITDLVVIDFSSVDTQYNFSTSTGQLFASGLNDRFYTVTLDSLSYSERTYFVNITNRSTQFLQTFLIPINESITVDVFIKTTTEDPIQDATIIIKEQIGGNFTTIAQGITDVTGFALFNLEEGTSYQWTITATPFTPRMFLLAPYSANSPYTFKLSSGGVTPFTNVLGGVNLYYSPTNQTLSNGSYYFNFTTLSTGANLLYTAIIYNNSNSIVNVSGSPSGSAVSVNVDLSGYQGVYPVTYIFSTDSLENNGTFRFTIPYYISNTTVYDQNLIQATTAFKEELSEVWMTIIAIFIISIGVVTTVQLSGNSIVGTIAGFGGMILFTALGWLSITTSVFMVIIGLILLFYSRGGY